MFDQIHPDQLKSVSENEDKRLYFQGQGKCYKMVKVTGAYTHSGYEKQSFATQQGGWPVGQMNTTHYIDPHDTRI